MAGPMIPGDPAAKKPQPGIGVNGPQPVPSPAIGVQGPGAIGTMAPHPDSPDVQAPHLPKWAADQVRGGGANPYHFVVNNGQLMKGLPHLGQPNGGNDGPAAPSVPAPPAPGQPSAAQVAPSLMPAKTEPTSASSAPIGVQGQAPAQGQPGIRSQNPPGFDPVRAMMVRSMRAAAESQKDMARSGLWDSAMEGREAHAHAERIGAMGTAISQYDHGQAQAGSLDPDKQVKTLEKIGNSPVAKGVYLGGKGVDPSMVPNPMAEGTPVNAGNMPQYLAQPQNRAMADVLKANGQGDLDTLLRAVQGFDGVGDKNHPNNQAIQEHLRGRYAANPDQWKTDTHVPEDPYFEGASNKSMIGNTAIRVGGLGQAAWESVFGGPASGGTGFGWPENFRKASERKTLLQRLNIADPTAPR
jgi:hypothetical protein